MRFLRNFTLFSFALTALFIGSTNSQAQSDTKSATAIEQDVQKRILMLPRYEVFDHIEFSVNGDTVTLDGKVRNAINKSDAEGSIKQIDGVNSVINNIKVLSPSGFDDQIRRELYARVHNTGGLSGYLWPANPDVRLIVDGGRITLEGTVRSRGDSDLMRMAALSVRNSFEVTNNLKIAGKMIP